MVQELIENYEAERSVIGSLLLNNNIALFAISKYAIDANCFKDAVFNDIFSASMAVVKAGRAVDAMTVGDQLRRDGKDVDSLVLDECIMKTPSATHCEYYCEALRIADNRRKLIATCDKAKNDIIMGKDVESITAFMNAEALGITSGDDVQSFTLEHFREEKIEQWRQAQEHGFVGIPWRSIPGLNEGLGGLRYGVMSILAAYRGLGKSTLVRQEAYEQALAGTGVALITIEDPGDIASAGIVGNAAEVSVFGLDTGNCRATAIDDMDAKWKEIGGIPLYICNIAMKIEQIISQITILKQRHDIKVAFVDHVQYITPYVLPGMSRNDTVAHYSSRFTETAKILDIHIQLVSQFGRAVERENRPPRMSDLRDSGSLEQDARQIIMLYSIPDQIMSGEVQFLEVVKNNYGKARKGCVVKRQDGKQRFSQESVLVDPPSFDKED